MRAFFILTGLWIGMAALSVAAQMTFTNKDVEEHDTRPIPVVESLSEPTEASGPGEPPPARNSYRPPRRNAATWQYDSEEGEVYERVEPVMPSGPADAQQRLNRMLGNFKRSTEDFDPGRYTGTRSFRGNVSIRLPDLPEGNYAFAFSTDSRTAYRLHNRAAQLTMHRSGRTAQDMLATSVQLAGGVYNFNMTRRGSVSFSFKLQSDVANTEGYVAYTVLPLHKGMRLKMQE